MKYIQAKKLSNHNPRCESDFLKVDTKIWYRLKPKVIIYKSCGVVSIRVTHNQICVIFILKQNIYGSLNPYVMQLFSADSAMVTFIKK